MDEDLKNQEGQKGEEEFKITFRNGALKRLKKVAADLGISENNLGEVLTKGINLIDIAKVGTIITIKKDGKEYVIDLRGF